MTVAGIFARAHAGARPDEERALYQSILLPMLGAVTDACGGFDWDDGVFNRLYPEIEHSLLGERHEYRAARHSSASRHPLPSTSAVTSSCACPPSASSRPTGPRLAACFRAASARSPSGAVRARAHACFPAFQGEAPDAPGELADSATALRLAAAAPVAAGPIFFERLDWRPYGIRPVPPIAATEPGESRAASTSSVGGSRMTCWNACPRATPTPSWGRRSTAGSCRCSPKSRSAPTAPRVAGRLARWRRRPLGCGGTRGRARWRPWARRGSSSRRCSALRVWPAGRRRVRRRPAGPGRSADARRPARSFGTTRRVAARAFAAAGELLRRSRRGPSRQPAAPRARRGSRRRVSLSPSAAKCERLFEDAADAFQPAAASVNASCPRRSRPDGEARQPIALGGGDDVVQQALAERDVPGGAGDPSCVREVLGVEVRRSRVTCRYSSTRRRAEAVSPSASATSAEATSAGPSTRGSSILLASSSMSSAAGVPFRAPRAG